jgi:hypothetical protein
MAFQLVYTSAAKLLTAGQSGFGTVARSKSITPLLVSAIERVSQFASMRGLDSRRIIHVHRRITAGSNRFHVLTRIVDAGADYSGRTNHIAHHLVISQEEAARAATRGITPADVLQQFPWLARWEGNARFFEAAEDIALESFRPDGLNAGRQSWASATGTAAHSRLLSWEGAPRTGVLIVPDAVDRLALLAEALVEFGPQSWSRSFTTSLETTDELSELEWIVTTPAAFAEIEPRSSSRTLLDLRNPASLPTPPPVVVPDQINVKEQQRDTAKDRMVEAAQRHQPVPRYGETQERPITAATQSPNSYKKFIPFCVAAAVLVLSAIIFWPTQSKSSSPNTAKVQDPIVTQKPPAESAYVKKMRDAGISKEDAEAIEKAAGANTPKWAAFLTDFPIRLKNVKNLQDLKTLQASCEVPPNQQDMPAWVTKVATARKSIPDDIDGPAKAELHDRLNMLGDIKRNFDEAVAENHLPSLKKEDCENFDKALVSEQLKLFFEKTTDFKSRNKQLLNSLTYSGGQFNFKVFPKRYEILSDYIKSHFSNFTSQESLTALETTTYFRDNTYENFKIACEYWNDPTKKIDSTEISMVSKSDFVPDDFADQLNKHRSSKPKPESTSIVENSANITPPPPNQSENKTPIKEVILVSKAQVENGVMSKTLKNALATDNAPGGITITVDSTRYIDSIFTQSNEDPNNVFWADHWDPKKASIKIYKNGIIQTKNIISTISIKYQESISYITIDQRNNDSLIKIRLDLYKKDENTITINGEFACYLKSIQKNSNLTYKILPSNSFSNRIGNPKNEDGFWQIKITPPPKINNEKITAKQLLVEFKNSKKDLESLIETRKDATNKELTKIDPQIKIKEDELKKIIAEFKKIIAALKIEKNIIIEIEKDHPNFEKIESDINKLTISQDVPENSINIDEVIEKIKNIAVTSQNGRVLIEATK